ncbi:MAG: hypothetical protein EZS28_034262 [Streblomastix strix]|uniref:Uncharacterized protein n=1 Tax=Streblomastix strix TaxID=222440 RepID=A0A5J4UJH9_9EUKA|nr:MAG: hypothetical protein EZS28_034262 [Streblomastix strix]
MTRRTNFTSIRPPNRDSYQTPNYANLVPQNTLLATAQPQPTFMNAFRQNLEIDPLDPDQTIIIPEEVPPNAITVARALLAGLSGQKNVADRFIRGITVRRASCRSQTTRKSSHRLGDAQKAAETQQSTSATDAHLWPSSHRTGNEIAAIVQTATGEHQNSKHNASADGHAETREPVENTTVTSNSSRVQQLDAEIVMSITPV